jgi:putative transposase
MHFKIGVKFMKRTYTQEEKQAIIDRFISGEPSANILADTGIPKSTFYG